MTAVLLALALAAAPEDAEYRSVVELYAQGRREEALSALGRFERRRLRTAVRLMQRWLQQAVPSAPDSRVVRDALQRRDRALRAAVMLHTDRALAERESEASRPHEEVVLGYLGLADELVDAEALAPFARRWYLGYGYVLVTKAELEAARSVFEQGLQRHAHDPELLLALGSVYERLAALPPQEPAGRASPRPAELRRRQLEAAGRRALLAQAEEHYAAAVRADAGFVEARVRRGRVLTLAGRLDDASAELARAAAEAAAAPEQVYLSQLLLGRAHELSGRTAEAIAAYRAAVHHQPQAQTGHLALGRALRQEGETAEARRALDAALRRASPFTPPDPWWDYPLARARVAEELLEALRAEASR